MTILARAAILGLIVLLVSCLGIAHPLLPTQPVLAEQAGTVRESDGADAPNGSVPAFKHIFIVVLENKEIGRVHQSDRAPYLNQLAATYGLATGYYGVAHPSLPNYLAILSGKTLGVTDDCERCYQSAPTLADQIEAHGLTWKAYFESMPGPCYVGSSPDGLYAQKHNPFIYFDAIRDDPARCGRIVPLDRLGDDLASGDVANLVWIGPNMRSSTHDAPVAEGDAWLAAHLPAVLQSPAFQQNGLLVVTYDEGDSSDGCCGQRRGGGNIMTVVASPLGKPGFVSDVPYSHYSLLRTIEDAWGLEHLGHAGDAAVTSLTEFFGAPASP
jgi:hypothetical protein